MKKPSQGAFGGHYNHDVIKQLRSELAKSRLMLAAVCKSKGITESELLQIATEFIAETNAAMQKDA